MLVSGAGMECMGLNSTHDATPSVTHASAQGKGAPEHVLILAAASRAKTVGPSPDKHAKGACVVAKNCCAVADRQSRGAVMPCMIAQLPRVGREMQGSKCDVGGDGQMRYIRGSACQPRQDILLQGSLSGPC